MRAISQLTFLMVIALAVTAIPVAARAATDPDLARMVRRHERAGIFAFKDKRYKDSIDELEKAYLLQRLPRFLREIAIACERQRDPDQALYFYRAYLAEASSDSPHRDSVEQAISDLESRDSNRSHPHPAPKHQRYFEPPPLPPPDADWVAQSQPPPRQKKRAAVHHTEGAPPATADEEPRRAPQPSPPPPPPPQRAEELPVASAGAAPKEWSHVPLDSVPPNQPIDVRVRTPVMRGVNVVAYYRGAGEAQFNALQMERLGPEVVTRIPADAVTGKSLQYYIEAKRQSGVLVKHSGSAGEPNIVFIENGAAPTVAAAEPSANDSRPPAAEDDTSTAPRDDDHPTIVNRDDEPAPLKPHGEEEESPLATNRAQSSGDPNRSHGLTTLGWVGVGLAGGGALIAGVGGAVAFSQAFAYANAVAGDANHAPLFLYNDPNSMGNNDKQLADAGKTEDVAGIVCVAAGSALAVTGVILIVVDRLHANHQPQRRGALWQRLSIAPAAARSGASLSAGFAF